MHMHVRIASLCVSGPAQTVYVLMCVYMNVRACVLRVCNMLICCHAMLLLLLVTAYALRANYLLTTCVLNVYYTCVCCVYYLWTTLHYPFLLLYYFAD